MSGRDGNHRQAAENFLPSIIAGTDDSVHRYGCTACDYGQDGKKRKDWDGKEAED